MGKAVNGFPHSIRINGAFWSNGKRLYLAERLVGTSGLEPLTPSVSAQRSTLQNLSNSLTFLRFSPNRPITRPISDQPAKLPYNSFYIFKGSVLHLLM